VRGRREDAEKKLVEKLRERDTGSSVDPSTTTLAEYLDEWLPQHQIGLKARERYEGLVKHQIKPFLGTVVLQQLTSHAVKRWHATLREKGSAKGGPLADRTILDAHRTLGVALAHAKEFGLVASNAVADISQPKVKDRREMQILKEGEPKAVLDKLAGHDLYAITHLALATGMRRGELLALAWPHVDFDRGTVRIERSLEQTKAGGLRFKAPKTSAGTRTITIPPATVHVLRDHRKKQLEQRMMLGLGKPEPNALVFPAIDGKPTDPDTLSDRWARACEQLDLPPIRFHDLRHTHASILIAKGEDVIKISRRLGHAKPSVTLNTYGHLFDHDDSSAAAAIAGVLG
jgi:integrase